MLKAVGLLGVMAYLLSSGFIFPRLTHGPLDYFLMPFLGYLGIVVAAQVAHRIPGLAPRG